MMSKKLLNLNWIEELLPKEIIKKPMFGGFGYYWNNLMVLAIFENSNDHTYKGTTFEYEIWNGCLLPTERDNHAQIKKIFPYLIIHPILTKWLYLPQDTERFEENITDILKQIKRKNVLFGIVPKDKKKSKVKKPTPVKIDTKIDTSKPMMFKDESIADRLAKAKTISDLKNLGPGTQLSMEKAGIKTVNQFMKLGWKKVFTKMVLHNSKNRHPLFAYAIIGAEQNRDWRQISETEKEEAKKLSASFKIVKVKKKI